MTEMLLRMALSNQSINQVTQSHVSRVGSANISPLPGEGLN